MASLGTKLRTLQGGFVAFWCPGCDGPHHVGVGDTTPRWDFNGNGDTPTFAPSILVNAKGPYHNPQAHTCHSYVQSGRIQFLADCSHDLAGFTVDLPDFDA